MPSNEDLNLEGLIIANGINGSTKTYLTPPMSPQTLLTYILAETPPADYDRLKQKEAEKKDGHLAPVHGVQAKKLDSAGWGVIYAPSIGVEIKEALSPLIDWREEQAGELFRVYDNYQIGWQSRTFLQKNETGLGPAEPEEMPYYLLIVGSPEEIPYNFQYELDVDRAVGRIYFDTAAEYHNYALSVVAAEKGEVRLPRRADFFSPANPNDVATRLSTDLLLEPLYQKFRADLTAEGRDFKWTVQAYLEEAATRSQLERLLGGDRAETPALLFSGCHGMGFNCDDAYQLAHQGALICQDWDGDPASISEKVYLAGDHITNDAQLHGLITFFFACYGAGTPDHDEFMWKVEGTPKKIAPHAFVSGLPRRLLSHPRGGALAVIGHIERAWTHSFKWSGQPSAHRAHFEGALGRLFDGFPIGYAFDQINERHASAAVQLTGLLEDKRDKLVVNDLDLIQTWMINNDARDYIILGDPAVRLCVSGAEAEAVQPTTIALHDIDLARYKPGGVMAEQLVADGTEAAPVGPVQVIAPEESDADNDEVMAIISSTQINQLKAALQSLGDKITQTAQNLSTLEVLTYLSDDDLKNVYDKDNKRFRDEARLKAVTLIGLDGDIQSMVPSRRVETLTDDNHLIEAVEIDEQLLNVHREMVNLAQTHRTVFFKSLAEVLVTLVNMQL